MTRSLLMWAQDLQFAIINKKEIIMSKNTQPQRKKSQAHQSDSTRKEKQKARERELDETLKETFPASDATAKY